MVVLLLLLLDYDYTTLKDESREDNVLVGFEPSKEACKSKSQWNSTILVRNHPPQNKYQSHARQPLDRDDLVHSKDYCQGSRFGIGCPDPPWAVE
jgi:hypothetical protein